MSRPARCIAIALASLALTAPAAGAMVVDPPAATGSPAPGQDLRNPDQRAPATSAAPTAAPVVHQAAAKHDDGVSPLVYVLPSAALLAALGAATGFVVSSGRFARSHARA